MSECHLDKVSMHSLLEKIRMWATDLGFDQIGITDTDLSEHEQYLLEWLSNGMQGEMDYMHRHGRKRTRPEELIPGTIRIISVRMNYLPPRARDADEVLKENQLAYISRYALGRDYLSLIHI